MAAMGFCAALDARRRLCARWWWNEVDALGVYDRLTGAATLARSLAPTLLRYNWTTWNPSNVQPASANAGWTVGLNSSSGWAERVLFWVYNRNHTWSAMHGGAELQPISGCTTRLLSLPVPPGGATANVTWVNTTTGLPLARGEHDAGVVYHAGGTMDLELTAPTFTTDVAAVVELVPSGSS